MDNITRAWDMSDKYLSYSDIGIGGLAYSKGWVLTK